MSAKLEVLLSDAVKKAIPQLISELRNQIQPSKTEMGTGALADLKKELKEELRTEIMLEIQNSETMTNLKTLSEA